MHPVEQNTPTTTEHRNTLRVLAGAFLSLLVDLTSALTEKVYKLLCSLLINLAADPYPAGELYDPSEEYELVREVLAMENLITGRFGSLVGPGRVMRLFSAVEPMAGLAVEPMAGLIHCHAATRTTDAGDDVFLSLELDPLMLDEHDGEPSEYSVQIIRTPADGRWERVDRQEFPNATAALVCFFSDEPVRVSGD